MPWCEGHSNLSVLNLAKTSSANSYQLITETLDADSLAVSKLNEITNDNSALPGPESSQSLVSSVHAVHLTAQVWWREVLALKR